MDAHRKAAARHIEDGCLGETSCDTCGAPNVVEIL